MDNPAASFRTQVDGALERALSEALFTTLDITPAMRGRFAEFATELCRANQAFNLTAITDPVEIAVKHIADSLTPLFVAEWPNGASFCDVGTGAGLPGLMLGVVRPDLQVTLVDSSQKKLAFVEACRRLFEIEGRTVHARAEELGRRPEHRDAYQLVTARAVARLPVLLELCLPLCAPGGWFVALKGPDVDEEIAESRKALSALAGRIAEVKPITLPLGAGERRLVAVKKEGPTPSKYPRRPGIPAKRPLV